MDIVIITALSLATTIIATVAILSVAPCFRNQAKLQHM